MDRRKEQIKKIMEGEDYIFENGYKHILYDFEMYSKEESLRKSDEFYKSINSRRSVREYSKKAVPKAIIENCSASP